MQDFLQRPAMAQTRNPIYRESRVMKKKKKKKEEEKRKMETL